MLDGKPQAQDTYCEFHKAPRIYYCGEDKIELCEKCAKDKRHEGHSMRLKSEIFSKAATKKNKLKGLLDDFEGEVNTIYGLLEENKKDTMRLMKDKFAKLRGILDKKEQEMTLDIGFFFTKERSRIENEINQNLSLKDLLKTKIDNLSQSTINDKLLKELENDAYILEFSSGNHYNMVYRYSKEIQQNIENSFNNLISLAESVIQEWKPLSELSVQQEADRMLGSAQVNGLKGVRDLKIEIEYGCLMIYPIGEERNYEQIERNNIVNLVKSKDLMKICLDFRKRKLSKELIDYIAEICKGMKRITFAKLLLGNKEFSDNDLLYLCHQNFWCSSQVESLYLYLTGARVGVSISQLSEVISGQNIKTFAIDCSNSFLDDSYLKEFSKNLVGRMKNIEWFSLGISYTRVTDYGIGEFYRELYKVMPNLQNLSLALDNTQITEQSFEYFNKTLLPLGKNIVSLNVVCPVFVGIGANSILRVIESAGSKLPKLKKLELEYNKRGLDNETLVFIEDFKKNHPQIVTKFS